MALVVGDRVFVRYRTIWHERLVLGICSCGQGWVIILTPNGDVFAVEVSDVSGHSFRVVGAGQDLPCDVSPANAYRFAPMPVGPALQQLLADRRQAGAAMTIVPST